MASIVPKGLSVYEVTGTTDPDPLFPEEEALVN